MSEQHLRDLEKRNLCATGGLTLVQIPYWWDNSISSLSFAIASTRQELIPILKLGEQ